MLVLTLETLTDLRAQARMAAPVECCGLLVGFEANGVIVVSSTFPVPNDVPDRYVIPPATFVAAERAARVAGAWVCGVYHSHPTGSAVPSALDTSEGWPGFVYVIVAGDQVRAWTLTDERRFEEVTVSLREEADREQCATDADAGGMPAADEGPRRAAEAPWK